MLEVVLIQHFYGAKFVDVGLIMTVMLSVLLPLKTGTYSPIDVQLSSDTSKFCWNRLKTFRFDTAFNDINIYILTIELSASVALRYCGAK